MSGKEEEREKGGERGTKEGKEREGYIECGFWWRSIGRRHYTSHHCGLAKMYCDSLEESCLDWQRVCMCGGQGSSCVSFVTLHDMCLPLKL